MKTNKYQKLAEEYVQSLKGNRGLSSVRGFAQWLDKRRNEKKGWKPFTDQDCPFPSESEKEKDKVIQFKMIGGIIYNDCVRNWNVYVQRHLNGTPVLGYREYKND